MSRNLNSRRKPGRTAKAAAQGTRAPAAVMAKRQNTGRTPAAGPVEVPD